MLGTDDTAAENAATSLLYAGEQYDSELSQYYLRARYYNPYSGSFNRTDPFAGNNQDPQSLHKYTYAHNNPINAIDPSGKIFVVSNWFYGRRVHDEIGYDFRRKYPVGGYYDRSINAIIGVKVAWWGWNRPDLAYKPIGSKTGEVWEIKPFGRYLDGSAQLGWYLLLLNSNDPERRMWIPGVSYTPPRPLNNLTF